MKFHFKEIFTAFMVLFAVIDIIGNIPIIIDLRKKVGHIQSEKASLIAGIIMIVFLFVGKSLLNLIGIDVNSFAVAGAFILFFIALEMILGITLYKQEDSNAITASVFPLAFPLIAGPGSLTTLILKRHGHKTKKMKNFTTVLSIIALGLIIFNATKLNFDTLLEGESYTAVITIIAAMCAIILLQILRISKKIEKLQKRK